MLNPVEVLVSIFIFIGGVVVSPITFFIFLQGRFQNHFFSRKWVFFSHFQLLFYSWVGSGELLLVLVRNARKSLFFGQKLRVLTGGSQWSFELHHGVGLSCSNSMPNQVIRTVFFKNMYFWTFLFFKSTLLFTWFWIIDSVNLLYTAKGAFCSLLNNFTFIDLSSLDPEASIPNLCRSRLCMPHLVNACSNLHS